MFVIRSCDSVTNKIRLSVLLFCEALALFKQSDSILNIYFFLIYPSALISKETPNVWEAWRNQTIDRDGITYVIILLSNLVNYMFSALYSFERDSVTLFLKICKHYE